MNHPRLTIIKRVIGRKLAIMVLLAASAAASFATLGEGNKKSSGKTTASLLSSRTDKPGTFSLRSGYTYRGNQVLNAQSNKQYISFNTTITYQKGNTTYIVPLKKKVALNNVKISLGNQQLRRN